MDEYLVQLGKRVTLLESRVARLEDSLLSSSLTNQQAPSTSDKTRELDSANHSSTRQRSIESLKEAARENGLDCKALGSRKISIKNKQGSIIPVYLSVSRNYSNDPSFVRGWNTMKESVLQSEEYPFYILSVEDASVKPTFFIFKDEELRVLSTNSDIDKNHLVHFYFGWDLPDHIPFSYPRNKKLEKQPLSEYENAWGKFDSSQ